MFMCFALCWQLILSSISFGLQRDADGELVLVVCSGGNMVTYTISADGTPISEEGSVAQIELCPFALASSADIPVAERFAAEMSFAKVTQDIEWRVVTTRPKLERAKHQRAPPEANQIT